MHWIHRVLRLLPKNHGALLLLSRCLAHAIMLYKERNLEGARRVAAKRSPEMAWRDVMYRNVDCVNRRVRRLVPAPSNIVPLVKQVLKTLQDFIDAKT